MKNLPTILCEQFSAVTAAKGIMKNIIPGKSYSIFVTCTFVRSRTKINVILWFFDNENHILIYFKLQLVQNM